MPYPDVLSAGLRGGVAHLDGRIIYALAGELDLDGSDSLLARVAGLLAGPGADLTLDLGEMTFIDSHGLRTLLEIKREADRSTRGFDVVNATPPVLRLLQITGVIEILDVHSTPEGGGSPVS